MSVPAREASSSSAGPPVAGPPPAITRGEVGAARCCYGVVYHARERVDAGREPVRASPKSAPRRARLLRIDVTYFWDCRVVTLFPLCRNFCLIFIFAFIFAYVRVFLRLRASAVQLCFGVKLRVDSARVPVRPPQLQAGVNGRFRYCCSGYAVWRATGGQPDAGGAVELPVCEGLEARYVPLPLLRVP